jgi:UTP--glucose-1-phosphate uridylyltransferase
MKTKIRKAVFPVAGFGTRFLPATKAMPKELLPIIDKPLIQYAVEEAIEAGIDTLIFVTGRNKRAIEDHFDNNSELERALRSKGKGKMADTIKNILPKGVECIFVRQPEQLGLGHAVLCAERVVGNEPFALILADDFLSYNGRGIMSELIEGFKKSGKIQLSVMKVNGPNISKYGVIVPNNETGLIEGLIEKPNFKNAPSRLASIGRYVLTPDIFDLLKNQSIGFAGEIQLTDSISVQASKNMVETVLLNGIHFDCGSIEGYINAIRHASLNYNFK